MAAPEERARGRSDAAWSRAGAVAAGGPPTASPRGAKEPRAGCAGKAPAARRGGTAARRGVGGTKAYDTPRAHRSTPRRAAGDATRGCARVRGCAAAQGLTTARRAQRGNAQWAQGAAYTPRAPRCATPRRRRSDHDNTTHRSAYVHAWRGLRRGQPVLRRPAGPQGGASGDHREDLVDSAATALEKDQRCPAADARALNEQGTHVGYNARRRGRSRARTYVHENWQATRMQLL